MDLAQRLITHWNSRGIICPPGVSANDIAEFELRYAVRMPDDLRRYFLAVNGKGPKGTCDNDSFSFMQLSEVRSIPEELPARAEGYPNCRQYFLVADHSIFLPAFAIRLTGDVRRGNPIVRVFTNLEIEKAFVSFSEFVECYLRDPLAATVASTW